MQHQVFMLNLALQFRFMSNIPGMEPQARVVAPLEAEAEGSFEARISKIAWAI